MLLFFVTIGAAAGSPRSILGCGWLAIFMVVQLAVHLGIVLGVGRAVGLPMQVSHTPNWDAQILQASRSPAVDPLLNQEHLWMSCSVQ